MTALAVLFLFFQAALGYLFSLFLDPEKKLRTAELFLASIVLGLALSSFLLLMCLLTFRSWQIALPLLWSLLIASTVFVILKNLTLFKNLRLSRIDTDFISDPGFWGILIFFALYCGVLFGVLLIDDKGLPWAIRIGWGDVAYHLNMIARLKVADPFILEHPVVSGEKLTYPFLINLLSALYEKIGFSKFIAWNLPLFLFGGTFFFLLFFLGKRLLSSKNLGLGLVIIVFFGGGIGFVWFYQDLSLAWGEGGFNSFLSTLTDPPHQYTRHWTRTRGEPSLSEGFQNIVWIVPAVSFLSHQRSFVAGASVAALIFLGFLLYRGNRKLWRWGILWGMIPFFHTHTFVAVSMIIFFWFFHDIKNWGSWIKGGVLGVLLALPQVIFLMPEGLGSEESSFFKPWLGWMMCTHDRSWYSCNPNVQGIDLNPLWFWTKNFGILFWFWVFALIGFSIVKSSFLSSIKDKWENSYSRVKPFILPSIVLFLLPHLVLFQPWEFDNNKILYFWWIFAAIISLIFLQALLERKWGRSLVLIIFVSLAVHSGMIDVVARIADFTGNHYGYYGEKEVAAARWIKKNTDPNDRFLTGDQPTQFVPMLTGRPIYLGYPGWLWSQGKMDLVENRMDLAGDFLYSGIPYSLCRSQIKYVLWDEDLVDTYPKTDRRWVLSVADVVFSQHLETGQREILKLKCPK